LGTLIPPGGTIRKVELDSRGANLWVITSTNIARYAISAGTCVDECNPVGPGGQETTTTTTTAIGPGGVGGEEGGFIGEPGSGIGLDLGSVSQQTGFSVGALAWILGILFVTAITIGMGSLTLVERRGGMSGRFNVPLAFVGFVLGVGGATAMSLLPVWFVVVLGVLGAGALVLRARGSAS
jgi:hypothetical protein